MGTSTTTTKYGTSNENQSQFSHIHVDLPLNVAGVNYKKIVICRELPYHHVAISQSYDCVLYI